MQRHGRRSLWSLAALLAILGSALLAPSIAVSSGQLGLQDTSFGTDGQGDGIIQGASGAGFDPGGVASLLDGSSLVADGNAIGVSELNSSGAPDTAFGSRGTAIVASGFTNADSQAVAVTPSGAYVVAGSISSGGDMVVAEFTSGGQLDTSFAPGSSVPGVYEFNNTPVQQTPASASKASDVVVQSDGTIIVVGTEYIGSPSEPALIVDRITSDGSGEERFSMQADGQPTTGDGVALAPNGTIYVTGTENAGSANAKAVVALITRGGFPAELELDASFNPSGALPGELSSTLGGASAQLSALGLAVASNGSAVIGGEADVSGTEQAVVARVTSAGAFDPGFGSGGVSTLVEPGNYVALSFVRAVTLEPNGAPIIAGDGDGVPNGAATRWFVAEMTTNGALDPQFDATPTAAVPSGANLGYLAGASSGVSVTGLTLDPQGRLLLAVNIPGSGSVNAQALVQRYFGYAPPTASFKFPATVYAGQAVTFDATASGDGLGAITDYSWDFDGSNAFATDDGSAATVSHTFASNQHVTVSLRVTNTVGQATMTSQPVNVLPAATTTGPAASVTPATLSLTPYVNNLNSESLDTNPTPIYVTNVGHAPLTISAVKLTTAGGWWITSGCTLTVGSDGYFGGSCPTITFPTPSNTCTGATLAPGTRCYVEVAYGEGGSYPKALATLEIDSNSPTSPDTVPLSAIATPVPSGTQPPQVRCPADIWANGAVAGDGVNGFGPKLFGCWTDVTTQTPNPQGDSWSAAGPVTMDDDVVLQPTQSADRLILTPQSNGNETLTATPGNASYLVYGSTENSGSVPTIPLGVANLGEHPYLCAAKALQGSATAGMLSPYGSCALPLLFTHSTPPQTIHGLPIVGGDIAFGTCGSTTSAYAQLPGLFSQSANPSPAPTVTFIYGTNETGCGIGAGSVLGSGSGAPPTVSCSGEKVPTPDCNGHEFPPTHPEPQIRRANQREVRAELRSTEALLRQAHPSHVLHVEDDGSGDSGQCPDGDEDYTNAAPLVFLGAMGLSNAYLCYDPTNQIWTTGGGVSIAGATIDTGLPPDYGISFDTHGNFAGAAIQLITFPGLGIPIAGPVTLSSFGPAGYGVHPTRIGAQATLHVGGALSIDAGGFAVWASPGEPYQYSPGSAYSIPGWDLQYQGPITNFAIGLGGTVSLSVAGINAQLAKAYVFYMAPSYFEFGGQIGINDQGTTDCGSGYGGSWCVGGGVLGAVDTGNGQYNVSGNVDACAKFPVINHTCIGVQGVVSSVGLGACLQVTALDGGFTYTYGGGFNVFGGVGPLGESCDAGLGPVTVDVSPSGAANSRATRAAGASGAVGLDLPADYRASVIDVYGDGGAPGLTVTGPNGQHLSAPGTANSTQVGGLMILPEPKLDETIVQIAHTKAEHWTIAPLTGSPAITKVTSASIEPAPKITAKVTGKGTTRTLSYTVTPVPDEVVSFAERGDGVYKIIGKATRPTGKLRFTPAAGNRGRRRILALITLAGAPKPTMTVASYTAPSVAKAGKPLDLRVKRGVKSLRISWGKTANASRYLAVVSLADGRRESYLTSRQVRSLTIAAVTGSSAASVKVLGVNALGADGPAAVDKLTAAAPPPKVTRLKAERSGKDVIITWARSRGAELYVLRLTGAGTSGAPPKLLTKPQFVSKRTLPAVARGRLVTITVTPLAATGTEGRVARTRYRSVK